MSHEIAEGNKLIAQFRGCKESTVYNGIENTSKQIWGFNSTHITERWTNHPHNWIDNTPYHEDWNLLMEVVVQIEDTIVKSKEDINMYSNIPKIEDVEYVFSVKIENTQCMIDRDVSPQYHGTTEDFLKLYDCRKRNKIKSTWEAVVTFIKWHNEQNIS